MTSTVTRVVIDFPEWVVVEVSLFLTETDAQLGMARVCRDWRRIFSVDLPAWRRVCFQDFGCDAVHPDGCTWSEWISQLRTLLVEGVAEEQQSRMRGVLHSGNIVLPPDFHFMFSSKYVTAQSILERAIEKRRSLLSTELVYLASLKGNEEEEACRRRWMIDRVMNLRALASEQREVTVTYRRHAQQQKVRRMQEEEKTYSKERTYEARCKLTRMRDELTEAVSAGLPPSVAARIATSADNDMLGLIPDSDMIGNNKARCQELRQTCRHLVKELMDQAEGRVPVAGYREKAFSSSSHQCSSPHF